MPSLLYCFISHQSALAEDINKWTEVCQINQIQDYLIVCGGYKQNFIHNRILHLNCDDTYEGLSTKTHGLFKFLIDNNIVFDYYAKIDRYIKLIKPVDNNLNLNDYCGSGVQIKKGSDGIRTYHFGKCSLNSEWNTKLYTGNFVPWCRGGRGYFLSNNAAKKIACHHPDMSYHIYEDLYVAETLLKYNIHPKNLSNLSDYLIDIDNLL